MRAPIDRVSPATHRGLRRRNTAIFVSLSLFGDAFGASKTDVGPEGDDPQSKRGRALRVPDSSRSDTRRSGSSAQTWCHSVQLSRRTIAPASFREARAPAVSQKGVKECHRRHAIRRQHRFPQTTNTHSGRAPSPLSLAGSTITLRDSYDKWRS